MLAVVTSLERLAAVNHSAASQTRWTKRRRPGSPRQPHPLSRHSTSTSPVLQLFPHPQSRVLAAFTTPCTLLRARYCCARAPQSSSSSTSGTSPRLKCLCVLYGCSLQTRKTSNQISRIRGTDARHEAPQLPRAQTQGIVSAQLPLPTSALSALSLATPP